MTDFAVVKDENLVGSNPRDLALLIVMKLQKDPAVAKTHYYYLIYAETFVRLAKIFFGLNPDLIKANFDQETVRGLEALIIQKAKKWSLATRIFMYGVPIIGWLSIPFIKFPEVVASSIDISAHLSYRFLRSRKRLLKIGVDPVAFVIKSWGIRDKEQ